MDKPRSFAPIVALVLLLLPVLYVGSYLALVKPQTVVVWQVTSGGYSPWWTHYRFGGTWAARVFWPLEQVDRRIRPNAWAEWRTPKPVQLRTTISADGLERVGVDFE